MIRDGQLQLVQCRREPGLLTSRPDTGMEKEYADFSLMRCSVFAVCTSSSLYLPLCFCRHTMHIADASTPAGSRHCCVHPRFCLLGAHAKKHSYSYDKRLAAINSCTFNARTNKLQRTGRMHSYDANGATKNVLWQDQSSSMLGTA